MPPVTSSAANTYNGPGYESSGSAVSWAAILGGVAVIVAMSFAFFVLGSGLGFSSISPWAGRGVSARHFTYMAATWLILVQWVSSGLGGYVTGRLRTKWVNIHSHEVFFRDTAHGFLTWAVAGILSGVILLFATSIATSGNMHDMNAGSTATISDMSDDADSLLRPSNARAPVDDEVRSETNRLLMKGMKEGSLADKDKAYLAQLVSSQSGISYADAQTKVDTTLAQERKMADDARKAVATASIIGFLSLMIGAFIASVAAALGGHERDEMSKRLLD